MLTPSFFRLGRQGSNLGMQGRHSASEDTPRKTLLNAEHFVSYFARI